jgi:DNA primase
MQHQAKYLIHAEIRTSGVVERSDVVGAVFGQTEGLLGEDLDLRTLQDSEKVGRIDVDIDSADGQSFGTFTVASGMDRVETAVLAASFETIERVGPCRAECRVQEIEDVRAAKRRMVVDRATELLKQFEETAVTGETLVEEVRKQVRAAEIDTYAGLPAGPNVETSDAVIVVEGRADVRQLLSYGIKNAIAVEGTNIPDAVAELTQGRTTTAFLDGDRGGDLILEELDQVAAVDYVAFAPDTKSVEDLSRSEVRAALEKKISYGQVTEGTTPREAFAPTEGGTVASAESTDGGTVTDGAQSATTAPATSDAGTTGTDSDAGTTGTDSDSGGVGTDSDPGNTGTDGTATTSSGTDASPSGECTTTDSETADTPTADPDRSTGDTSSEAADEADDREPQTLLGHVEAVVAGDTGQVRLLDDDLTLLASDDAAAAFQTIADSEPPPSTVILDGAVTQRILDIAAQRGVGQVVGTDTDTFVKQPTSVRVRTAEELL